MYNILLVNEKEIVNKVFVNIVKNLKKFKIAGECYSYKESLLKFDLAKIDIIFSEYQSSIEMKINYIEEIYKKNKHVKIFFIANYSNLIILKSVIDNINHKEVVDFILKPITNMKIVEVLENYEKKQKNLENLMIDEVYQEFHNHNFKKVYLYITYISTWLKNHKDINISDKMDYIEHKIISTYIDSYNIKDLVNEQTLLIDYENIIINNLYPVWLFDTFDYIFKKRTMDRYPIMENFYNYIDNNIDQNISLKDVVDNLNISQGYLSRIFKKEYNLTILNYIHLKKINKAKFMFLRYDSSIVDVCYKLGYKESSYFCKVFKKYENLTVEEFKNCYKKE
ncbi:AraC family transcriptional regulator [Anaerococcus sp. AGMB09787]|uniref:AraC family transcriptional regulator n=1 Tax=Anaerococcus sp. AGMB09787 TaxID=2922869 RepID=UPI001FAFD2C1|nr:AraC family transcriptional regulator [Anaerococcus sp. AGMB09787]